MTSSSLHKGSKTFSELQGIYFEREYPGFSARGGSSFGRQTGDESRIERERKYHGLQPVEVYSERKTRFFKAGIERLVRLDKPRLTWRILSKDQRTTETGSMGIYDILGR